MPDGWSDVADFCGVGHSEAVIKKAITEVETAW
jgi:hypothetical protein